MSIVPRLLPAVDGVGDYALSLSRQLRLDFGIETHFIVGDPAWIGNGQLEEFNITKITTRSAKALFDQLAQIRSVKTILLHYVGYGYAKRGCPFWLVEGLENWVRQHPEINLVTMFHEISASGPVWTSTFWLSALQRNLAVKLVNLSDRVLTSKKFYADILQQIVVQQANSRSDRKLPVLALPVFSNVGEPRVVLPLEKRDRTLVVFGGLNTRIRAYQHCLSELIWVCKQFGLKKIIDIGPTNGLNLPEVDSLPVDRLGARPALEISQILSSAFAGFIDYPIDFLGKSTVFAGYCAHGVLPIVRGSYGLDTDGLIAQHHYWHLDSTCPSIDESIAQNIANNAYSWYQSHNLAIQADQFASALT